MSTPLAQKHCPRCGHANDWWADYCEVDKESLQGVTPVRAETAPTSAVEARSRPVPGAATVRLPARIALVCEDQPKFRFEVVDGCILGKGAGANTIDLSPLARSAYISKRHASLWLAGIEWSVRDEHSTNGTFINGQRLAPGTQMPLAVGDLLTLANTSFVLRLS